VFIDETWTKTNMTRLYGWAKRGKRLIDKTAPHSHWKTTTFVAALRNDRIDAPCRFDGPINGERFRAYVEQELVPTLKSDDIVVLDNLGSHQSKAARCAQPERASSSSPYSPDLNPIEPAFATLKSQIRKAKPRTVDPICDAMREILTRFSSKECGNYLVNAGYAPS
jgi:putative transposase